MKPLSKEEKEFIQVLINDVLIGKVQEFYLATKTEQGTEYSFSSEGGQKLANRINRRNH